MFKDYKIARDGKRKSLKHNKERERKGYIDKVINSLTPQQVRLYVDCIIEYAEGAVYPDFLQHLVDDFEIPKHWKRYLAHDPKQIWGLVG